MIYDKKGKVIAIGKNSYIKTHPFQAKHAKLVGEDYKIYLHAEIDAIIKCKDINKAHKISIFRHNPEGFPMNAAPCQICLSAIKQTNIKIIEHT